MRLIFALSLSISGFGLAHVSAEAEVAPLLDAPQPDDDGAVDPQASADPQR